MTKSSRYAQQIIIIPRQGPWNMVWVKQVFELSEVDLTEFHCIWPMSRGGRLEYHLWPKLGTWQPPPSPCHDTCICLVLAWRYLLANSCFTKSEEWCVWKKYSGSIFQVFALKRRHTSSKYSFLLSSGSELKLREDNSDAITIIGALVWLVFKWLKWISVAKSAKLFRSATEKAISKTIFHFRSPPATEITRT